MSGVRQALSSEQPFPGLRPFDYGDQEYFFGREQQTGALYGLLDRTTFVAVVGGSGSGKSSLAKAGLLPILETENRRSPSRKWTWCEMRPGNAPLAALEGALIALADVRAGRETDRDIQRQHIHYQLNKTSFGLADAVGELGIAPGERFILLVDQFEELFGYSSRNSLAPDPLTEATLRSQAKRFVELLLEGRRSTASDIRILITMRSDFIGDCADFPGLPEAVSASQYLVPALDRTQIEAIIVKPIEKAAATIEPGLVQQLLADVEGEPDQLPVLQHCLLRLWKCAGSAQATQADQKDGQAPTSGSNCARRGRNIGVGCYEAVGTISNALNLHADKVLGKFRGSAVEAVFRALSELRDGRAIRRLLPYPLLQAECAVPDEELTAIINGFRADDCSFLVISPSGAETFTGKTLVYVGHEALLRRWERLRGDPAATGEVRDARPIGWLREERRDGQRYQSLLTMLQDDKIDDVSRQLKWWNERVRTEQWANRYGGKFKEVEAFLGSAQRGRNIQRWRITGLSAVVAFLFGVVIVLVLNQYRQDVQNVEAKRLAERNFARSVDIAKKFLNDIKYAVNHGNMNLDAAGQMGSSAEIAVEDLYKHVPGEATSNNTKALIVDLNNFIADVRSRTNPGAARRLVMQAHGLALQLVQIDAQNDEWQYLLFQSRFRYGDILDDQNKASEALKEFQQAELIIHRLADKNPHEDGYQYFLAFITAKIGVAYKNDERYAQALDQLRMAVGIAEQLAANNPDNPEWQALVPSTMSKIADILASGPQPDLLTALHQYDAALVYQRSLITTFPADAIIESNFMTTLRNRAKVLAQIGQWAEAEAQFDEAIKRRESSLETDMANAILLPNLATDYQMFVRALVGHAGLMNRSQSRSDQQRLLVKARELADKEIVVRQRLANIEPQKKDLVRKLVQAKNRCDEINSRLGDVDRDGHCFGETLPVRLFGTPNAARSLQVQAD
jgi:tetratricopeptide (TPR) repeat protein